MSGDTKLSCPAQSSEDAIKWAAENGLVVVLPDNNQLLIDIDSHSDLEVFNRNRDIIDQVYGISDVMPRVSRSGNTHLTVTLRTPISPLERIALQAVLGSDRRRESHSLRRLMAGELSPSLFFEKNS
jgi:hypothetical protein